jgi:outer membrane protein TolC
MLIPWATIHATVFWLAPRGLAGMKRTLATKFVFLGWAVSLSGIAHADSSSIVLAAAAPQFLSFDEAARIALRENVDLQALRNLEAALKFQSRQALSPNNPVLSFTKNDIPGFNPGEDPAQTVYMLNWTLGFPGKAWSSSSALRHQAEAAGQNVVNQEIALMNSLSNAYASFANNQAFYEFLLDEQKQDKELRRLIERKYAASQAAKVDILNQEVTTQQIAQAILQNRNDYAVQLTQFRQLLRRPEDHTLFPKLPDKIAIPAVKQTFEQLVPVLLRNNHAINAARHTEESAASQLHVAQLQAFPDLQLSAGINKWKPTPAPNQGLTRDYTLGLGLSIPIWFPFNELNGIHAAEESRAAAENQATSQQLQAIAALQTAYTSFGAALKDLEASEKLVVPAAKAAYDLTLLTYGLGKADYFVLGQARKTWHDSMRDMLTKRQAAVQLYTQLIAQMGCDIASTEGPYVCQ